MSLDLNWKGTCARCFPNFLPNWTGESRKDEERRERPVDSWWAAFILDMHSMFWCNRKFTEYLSHAFTLLFPLSLQPHVPHYSAQALPRIFWHPIPAATKSHTPTSKTDRPTSPNAAPATKNDCDADCSSSHMKRHIHCGEQQDSPSNVTKYYRLPRKMILMIDHPHIWNVIYNARSNRTRPPTSPNNTACHGKWFMIDHPHIWNSIYNTRGNRTSSNISAYCACHEKWHSKIREKFAENGWSVIYIGGWFQNDPNMIRTLNWSSRQSNITKRHASTSFLVPVVRGFAVYPGFCF